MDTKLNSIRAISDNCNGPGGRKSDVHKEDKSASAPVDLDFVLEHELGQFGGFQLYNVSLILFAFIMTGFGGEFYFTTAAIPHRCMIPECGETPENMVYDQPSLGGAFPQGDGCQRFAPLATNGTLDHCPSTMFDNTKTIHCDALVYQNHNSVVYEFNLGCNNWLRALAGTLRFLGIMLGVTITGYISDRWGRRVALVSNIFNTSALGLLRAFSFNYTMFLSLEFLQPALGDGLYSCGFILANELVGPKYRVRVSACCSMMFSIGYVLVGGLAWAIPSWRLFTIVLFAPCFLMISYYWLLTESVRWLLAKKKYDRVKIILKKIAKINKRQISEKSMQALTQPPLEQGKKGKEPIFVLIILKSPILLRRVCTTPVWWITMTFVYYGLSVKSTSLPATNMYVSFMMGSAIEIPGFVTSLLLLNRIGRRATLSIAYIFCAVCNIAFVVIPIDFTTLRLIVYLMCKYNISMAIPALYLFTSELYPTQHRHRLLAFSSMIGRVGSILAPLMPLLDEYFTGFSNILFGALSLVSGLLVLTQPETLGTKMPDTLAEAEALVRQSPKIKSDACPD